MQTPTWSKQVNVFTQKDQAKPKIRSTFAENGSATLWLKSVFIYREALTLRFKSFNHI